MTDDISTALVEALREVGSAMRDSTKAARVHTGILLGFGIVALISGLFVALCVVPDAVAEKVRVSQTQSVQVDNGPNETIFKIFKERLNHDVSGLRHH